MYFISIKTSRRVLCEIDTTFCVNLWFINQTLLGEYARHELWLIKEGTQEIKCSPCSSLIKCFIYDDSLLIGLKSGFRLEWFAALIYGFFTCFYTEKRSDAC